MATDDRTLAGFRIRLQQLIHDQYEGKWTLLAQRAGIPVSSLQHSLHHARRLPGGDLLLRLADVLEVTVDYLLAGRVPGDPVI